jgi:hypothetical protein
MMILIIHYYNIKDNSVIEVEGHGLMQLFIKWMRGQTYTIHISKDDTVRSLCLLINHRLNIHDNKYKLLYNGNIITNNMDKSLEDFNIEKDTTIHGLMCMKGD